MLKHFISLESKRFFRSSAFKKNLALKIIIGFFALLLVLEFLILGGGSYYLIQKGIEEEVIAAEDPFAVINKYLIYWFVIDLMMRYFIQKMPAENIQPLLYLPFKKEKIVNYAIGKTVLSFFTLLPAFFFVPFSIVLLIEGYDPLGVIGWHLCLFALTLINNFTNIFANNLNKVFYPTAAAIGAFWLAGYYDIFDITLYTGPVFKAFYDHPYLVLVVLPLAYFVYKKAHQYYTRQLYLDQGLQTKVAAAESEDYSFLDRFGKLAVYLKNDIKLIRRNKRARITFFMGLAFVLYGFFFMNDTYDDIDGMKILAGLFVSGGFLFSFGGLVPSWDSSYYKLMMSQNIPYREFLLSKWWLMVICTVINFILGSFYLYFGLDWWLAILSATIYNIGLNSSIVLWGGAYVKSPIDLNSSKNAFGDSKAFNIKTLLLVIPKIILPVLIYYAFSWPFGEMYGFLAVSVTGVIGLLFRDKIFTMVEKIYKNEKYDTIAAYSQKK